MRGMGVKETEHLEILRGFQSSMKPVEWVVTDQWSAACKKDRHFSRLFP